MSPRSATLLSDAIDLPILRQCDRSDATIGAQDHRRSNTLAGTLLVLDYTDQGNKVALEHGNIHDLSVIPIHCEAQHRVQTRWYSISGNARRLIEVLTEKCLNGHGFLVARTHSSDRAIYGGPTRISNGTEAIWFEVGVRSNLGGTDSQECPFRLVILFSRGNNTGTLITQFLDSNAASRRLSRALEEHVLHLHPERDHSLRCVWVAAFAALRFIAQQLNHSFKDLDPIHVLRRDKCRDDQGRNPHTVHTLVDLSFRLASIERYLSGIKELSDFCMFVWNQTIETPITLPSQQDAMTASARAAAKFEAFRLEKKIQCEERLCDTYTRQCESLIQLKLSFGTSQIVGRLDEGAIIAEKVTKIGLVVGAIASMSATFGVLTSFYGMNVKELQEGARASLFDFWTLAVPVVFISVAAFTVAVIWLMTGSIRRR